MFNISNYLNKITKKIHSEEDYSRNILSVVNMVTGLNIGLNNVEIKNYILYINTNFSAKNKIFINKSKIISEINQLSSEKIVDIR